MSFGRTVHAAGRVLRACALRGCMAASGLSAAGPAGAQEGGERRGGAAGDFDFYVLALSWSPGFCSVGGGDDKGREQCRSGSKLGFVVHGLWRAI